MRLQGKVAIVTGGSRGIGFAVCQAFVREGARVAICGSKIETAQKAVDEIKAKYPNAAVLPIGVNVSSDDEVSAMVKMTYDKWGSVDILVNNAGITSAKSIIDTTVGDFSHVMDINVTALFRAIRAVTPIMMEQNSGSIINTSSMVGTYGGKNQCAYGASKFAVNGLTKSVAKELGPHNIRCNAVAPGVVGTDMVSESVDERTMAGLKMVTPLGRMAQPQELAELYVYLASDESSFTTAAIIHVDGGIVL